MPARFLPWWELPSPTRGIRFAASTLPKIRGITPAYAGNTCFLRIRGAGVWNYPRLRGEYVFDPLVSVVSPELPPLARGIPSDSRAFHLEHGITPACARNASVQVPRFLSHRKYPRLRGEYVASPRLVNSAWELPPHARGIPVSIPVYFPIGGITPACAGNTLRLAIAGRSAQNYPRLRGKYDCAEK